MQKMTLCFLKRTVGHEEILLGLKRDGFGAGKFTGIGGKVEAGETVTMAAIRELEEETGVRALETELQQVAHLTFVFPAKPDWSQSVHVFLVTSWDGHPTESAEVAPVWFSVNDLPFERMWDDSVYWLPRVLGGERIRAVFTFGDDNNVVEDVKMSRWDETSCDE